MTEGIELPNQGKIRTFGQQETYEYLRIIEADTNKQKDMKEKMKKKKKNTAGEWESYSKPNNITEISSKG